MVANDDNTKPHENESENLDCLGESIPTSAIEASCTTSNAVDYTCTDIGLLLKNGCEFLRNLSGDHKLLIINSNPDSSISAYPTTFMNGCNRRFKAEWIIAHPWLHYSQSEDGAYCKACSLFSPELAGGVRVGVLVNQPFRRWTSHTSVFSRHEKSQYHINSMAKMVEFKNVYANPSKSIENVISKKRDERIQQNKKVIKALMECVTFCGTQGLSLRGHRETATEDGNKGNFLELVAFRARTDALLASHLKNAPKNARYTSKNIQNELVSVLGDCVRTSILSDIKEAKFFSILADEVTDCSNLEQLSIAIRFVDNHCLIREEFLDFVTVERITGNALASAI